MREKAQCNDSWVLMKCVILRNIWARAAQDETSCLSSQPCSQPSPRSVSQTLFLPFLQDFTPADLNARVSTQPRINLLMCISVWSFGEAFLTSLCGLHTPFPPFLGLLNWIFLRSGNEAFWQQSGLQNHDFWCEIFVWAQCGYSDQCGYNVQCEWAQCGYNVQCGPAQCGYKAQWGWAQCGWPEATPPFSCVTKANCSTAHSEAQRKLGVPTWLPFCIQMGSHRGPSQQGWVCGSIAQHFLPGNPERKVSLPVIINWNGGLGRTLWRHGEFAFPST